MSYIQLNQIKVANKLADFINQNVLPGLEMEPELFWSEFESILTKHIPENKALLMKRDEIQQQIDTWHQNNQYDENNLDSYKQFLIELGYLVEEGDDFDVEVKNVDREISTVAAPQLVVPINNARFAINAANARWGSLYDALYGTDMIANEGETSITAAYNEKRGAKVFEFCQQWLDDVLPLSNGSHTDVVEYNLDNNDKVSVSVKLADGTVTTLKDPEQFIGYSQDSTSVFLFIHNDLHFELHCDKKHPMGALHQAGLKDVVVEAAVTTIEDFEDSVAAVDVEDKILVYKNWLGLIKGTLCVEMKKSGKTLTRQLNSQRQYKDTDNKDFELPGKSLMLARNTGIHMKTDLVLTQDDEMVPEGIVDALVTVLISRHDLLTSTATGNSRAGSIYIVKPKMHGPDEVAFSCKVFSDIESAYGLAKNTVKIGIMDEERRTTVNLKECIRQAKDRVIFINTGFLDRTGDEIHTSMEAGPMLPKAEIKTARWMPAYEDWNVDIGLSCGLDGHAQIGKGMWAIPDRLKEMYDSKSVHPEAGANCAWVPSPTAATLHALHYHQIKVKQVQQSLKQRKRANVDFILSVPLLPEGRKLTPEEIQQELDNNAQGILGYVVKWIDMGIGCSKVPDIHDTGLMEDRATLRISSQHMANWLKHGLCNEQQVVDTFKKMALVVDQQNSGTPGYSNLAPSYDGVAYKAALELVLQGVQTANGYTEDLLQDFRRQAKSS